MPQNIDSGVQLLVEGNDQRNFFEAFIDHLSLKNIQVRNYGGVNDLRRFGSNPAVSVFILPDNQSEGMLETLLCRTLAANPLDRCIDDFFECVKSSTGESLRRPDKARAHAYIATQCDPHVSVGVATQRGYWHLDHTVFDGVRNFLRSL